MNRTGLIFALAIAVLVGVIFGVDADLDVRFSRPFFEVIQGSNHFGLSINSTIMKARDFSMWLVGAMVVSAVAAFAIQLVLPPARRLISNRAMAFLLVTIAIGPGVLANVILKEHWGRSRPIDVVQLGGSEKFVAWWDPRGECRHNCSFVSGDISAAFWTLAPAALAPPACRALAYGGAIVFGVAVSLMRIAVGAHFFTDAVFAGVFMFLIIWTAHRAIYGWPKGLPLSPCGVRDRLLKSVSSLFGNG